MNPTYPRFVVLKTINIIGTAAFCPSWAKIRLTRVRLIRGLLYVECVVKQTISFLPSNIAYFSFQPVLHDWCNKDRCMCYPFYGIVNIKELLLLIGKSNPCGGRGFSLSLAEWSSTICPMTNNRKLNGAYFSFQPVLHDLCNMVSTILSVGWCV